MEKQSQNASSEAIKKAVLKGIAIGISGLTMLAGFTACDKTKQKPSEKPDTKPPVVDPIDPVDPTNPVDPVEKTISINKIYNDYFSSTSFDADIQSAQNALAERIFNNLTPQISNITYNANTKELTFDINYVENGKSKSGSMKFTAPTIFQEIRGKQAKEIVLNKCNLSGTSNVKESEESTIKTQIANAISQVRSNISQGFTNVKTNSVAVEKEQDPIPVETISFDELIADELGEYLGDKHELQSTCKSLLDKVYVNRDIQDDFKIAIDNNTLTFYLHNLTPTSRSLLSAEYKGVASEFEDYINAALNQQALLDKYFDKLTQNHLEIELNSSLANSIIAKCNQIKESINAQKANLSNKQRTNFNLNSLASHNIELSQEEALQFALKRGYTADEVLGVYVGTPSRHTFDSDELFTTGYLSFYTVSVLSLKNGQYSVDECRVVVPHYTDSQQADYYRYFLEGEKGKRYITEKETSTAINGIIVDYAEEKATAQSSYVKVASYNDYDLYLPERF